MDRLDTVECIGNDGTLALCVLIGLTSASDLLNGNWGIYDVDDCKEAATILSSALYPYIDEQRVAIRGGSAGAYTTLSSLTFAPDEISTFYKTGCGAYGCVADVEYLTKVTEKFEMRYCYTLFGCPPDGGAWDPRNPIKNVGKLSRSLLVRDNIYLIILCGTEVDPMLLS